MAQGQRTFSSADRTVKQANFTPPIPADYDALMRFNDWKISVAEGVGKLPRVNGPIELLDTAANENAKNKTVYHDFFLDLSESPKDGVAMVDRGGGIVQFCQCNGLRLEGVGIETKQKMLKDSAGQETGELTEADILNPQEVLAFLKEHDGMVVRLRTKIETSMGGKYAGEKIGKVAYFIETEQAVAAQDDEPTDEPSDEAEAASDEPPAPPVNRPVAKTTPAKPVARANGAAKGTPQRAAPPPKGKPAARPTARR
jgi:hypothetical protein